MALAGRRRCLYFGLRGGDPTSGRAWLALAFLTVLCLRTTLGHVALTFPPARRFAVDGLSNAGQNASPCGMPKGLGPQTSVPAGNVLNITWNLALPHQGGYRLELLDSQARPLMDLTPMVGNSKFSIVNPMSQSHTVNVPTNLECKDCTIRLVQQALEWAPDLNFHSCSDVDIVRVDFIEDCMGRGEFQEGHCMCKTPFEGNRCQYRNDCSEDADCGSHSECIDLGGSNYPRRQCFCHQGWFGEGCHKESPVKSLPVSLRQYSHRTLAKGMDIYWRLVNQETEVEVIMVLRGTSYVGIGWRPLGATTDCKKIALIPHTTDADSRRGKELSRVASSSTSSSRQEESQPISGNRTQDANDRRDTTTPVTTTHKPETSTRIRFPSRRLTTRLKSATSTTTTTTTTTTRTTAAAATTSSLPATTTTLKSTTHPPTSVRTEVQTELSMSVTEYLPESTSNEQVEFTGSTEVDHEMASSETHAAPFLDLTAVAADEFEHLMGVEEKSYYSANQERRRRQTGGTLHPMECTDMVIGAVRGTSSRIRDFYSWSTSTPQPDAFWGGREDLTAALGLETNGTTTILFRKRLQAGEAFDTSIEASPMHFIWAKGFHDTDRSRPDASRFFVDDELKYHGHAEDQRGATTINFHELTPETPQMCRGDWKYPPECGHNDCEYRATWEFQPASDDIRFTIFTTHTARWTGIGFSRDKRMNNSDVVIGWVDDNGRYFMMDMWVNSYMPPFLDEIQNIDNQAGRRDASGSTLMFTRKRDTGDSEKDLAFSETNCLYLLFPYHGGQYYAVSKKLQKHESTPAVSAHPLCFASCEDEQTPSISPTDHESLAKPPPSIMPVTTVTVVTTGASESSSFSPDRGRFYLVELRVLVQKLINLNSLGENNERAHKNKIRQEVTQILQNVSNFREVQVLDLQRDSEWLVAKMNVFVNDTPNLPSPSTENSLTVESAMNSSVSTGRVGRLFVDSAYLVVEPPAGLDGQFVTTFDVGEDPVETDKMIALYAAGAALIALGLLALIQIVCSLYRCRRETRTHTSKERLISTSGWKDYSMSASSNYSYEPFSHDEEGSPAKGGKGNPPKGPPGHKNGHMVPGDSRSLSRNPRGVDAERGGAHYSRRSESLPRLGAPPPGYVNHEPHGGRGGAGATMPRSPMELQPDFYFMPSQRRYSGEVVRVYVDYNNPNFSGK